MKALVCSRGRERPPLGQARRILLAAVACLLLGTSHAAHAAGTSREAGYAFAKRLNIVDVNRCAGPTTAFVEGCRAFARQFAARQSFTPNGAYYSGNVAGQPYWYRVPVYSPIRQFE